MLIILEETLRFIFGNCLGIITKKHNVDWLFLQSDNYFITILLMCEHFYRRASNWECLAFFTDASFYILMKMSGSNYGTGRGNFSFSRVPVLQQLTIIVLWKWSQSVFGVHWVLHHDVSYMNISTSRDPL